MTIHQVHSWSKVWKAKQFIYTLGDLYKIIKQFIYTLGGLYKIIDICRRLALDLINYIL